MTASPTGRAPGAVLCAADLLPSARWQQRHRVASALAPAEVVTVARAVGAQDLAVGRLLFALRLLPARLARRPTPFAGRPLLEALLAYGYADLTPPGHPGFLLALVGQPHRPLGGRVVPVTSGSGFAAYEAPGFVKVAFDLTVTRGPGGSLVTTETRVDATDPRTARRFGAYWRVAGPGAALVRRDLLRSLQGHPAGPARRSA